MHEDVVGELYTRSSSGVLVVCGRRGDLPISEAAAIGYFDMISKSYDSRFNPGIGDLDSCRIERLNFAGRDWASRIHWQ